MRQLIQANRDRYFSELFSLLRIPSISSKTEHKADMMRCAERWQELLLKAGVDHAEIMPSSFNPVVFGEKIVDESFPTVLIYGHYDVMPVDPLNLWNTDPFEPIVKDGKIWGRGADDDKGQSFIQAKAFELMNQGGQLRCNVKFLLEGGEEVGSPGIEDFCIEHKEMLKCDFILVSDTSMVGADMPSITTGLRGLAYLEIEVTGPDKDLHSGLFGGAVANPINVLCKLIADVQDEKGGITIPSFYDDVEDISQIEREMQQSVPLDLAEYRSSIGVKALKGEQGYCLLEQTGMRPTFDVCGIWGGYTGEGAKTVLPSKATAKLSYRLVPHQENHKISRMVKEYFESIAPDYVTVKVTEMHGAEAYVCPISIPAYQAASDAYEHVFGVKPLAVRRGGSIGIISSFEKVLGVKTILMGFGLEEDAIHSPNENFTIDIFEKGIETVCEMYKRINP